MTRGDSKVSQHVQQALNMEWRTCTTVWNLFILCSTASAMQVRLQHMAMSRLLCPVYQGRDSASEPRLAPLTLAPSSTACPFLFSPPLSPGITPATPVADLQGLLMKPYHSGRLVCHCRSSSLAEVPSYVHPAMQFGLTYMPASQRFMPSEVCCYKAQTTA